MIIDRHGLSATTHMHNRKESKFKIEIRVIFSFNEENHAQITINKHSHLIESTHIPQDD